VVPTGINHGTISIVINNNTYEVTTFRKDGDYLDARHPDSVVFVDNIQEDLSRRDFTINAMAYNPSSGLIDLFGGLKDIENKIIRCVGDPEIRFNEDALRMMRSIRFSAQLNFSIHPDTFSAILDNNELIHHVSNERIRDEINKILLSDQPEKIKDLYMSGLLKYIIPELSLCFGFDQRNPHHIYDVGDHLIETSKYVPRKLYLRIAALLHDVGKPETIILDENGIGHFRRHEDVSELLATEILRNLKYDNTTISTVSKLILYHMWAIPTTKKSMRKLLNKIGEASIKDWFVIKVADARARNFKSYRDVSNRISKAQNILREVLQEEDCFSLKDLAINGEDLKSLGYKQGKIMGDILEDCLNLVIEDESKNNKEFLFDYIKEKEYI